MSVYGVAILPLADLMGNALVNEKWYADNCCAIRNLMKPVKALHNITWFLLEFWITRRNSKILIDYKGAPKIQSMWSFWAGEINIVDGCRDLWSVLGNEHLHELFLITTLHYFPTCFRNFEKLQKICSNHLHERCLAKTCFFWSKNYWRSHFVAIMFWITRQGPRGMTQNWWANRKRHSLRCVARSCR